MSEKPAEPRLEINWAQSLGGALAAVSSAVLLSTFGVAGTLIGAALGSLVITIGGAIYSYSLRKTRQRVARAQALAASRIGRAQSRVRAASDGTPGGTPPTGAEAARALADAERDLDRAQAVLDDGPDPAAGSVDWRTMVRELPWKRIGLGAFALFVAAMALILAFELLSGRAVSSYTGGSNSDQRTSIPGTGGGSGPATDQPEKQPESPSDDVEEPPADQPTTDPTESVPSDPPSPEPTDEPTDAPPEAPTPEPLPSP